MSLVFDVGANEGQFGRALRRDARYRGRIHSFEPSPTAFKALEAAASGDESWTTQQLAVGDEPGEAELTVFEESDWNSLHALDAAAVARTGRSLKHLGTVQCRVERLDDVWTGSALPGDRVFLKSDTQGHEVAVIRGAASNLHTVVGLLLEVSIRHVYENEPRLQEVLDVAQSHDFVPSGFFPVMRTRGTMALDTIDICFVRQVDRA